MLFFLLLFFLILIFVLSVFLKKGGFKSEIKRSLDYQLFLISSPRELPHSETEQKKSFLDFVSNFEQFLETFSNYKKEIILEIAVPNNSPEIFFYVAFPKKDAQFFEKTLSSFFPDSQIEPVNDYTIFSPEGLVASSSAFLKNSPLLPLKNLKSFSQDPLSVIVNAFTKIAVSGEGMALQLVLKPYQAGLRVDISKVRQFLSEGKSLKDIPLTPSLRWKDFLSPQAALKENQDGMDKKNKEVDENLIKLIEEKVKHPSFLVNIRLLASAYTLERAEELLYHLESALNPFSDPLGNSFILKRNKQKRKIKQAIYDFSFRNFKQKEAIILNSAEVSSLFHFPHPFLDNPRIKWLKAKSAPFIPFDLGQKKEGIVLGINFFRGEKKEVKILDEDRRRHIYIIGQTGTGKTSLMKNMIIQDMERGKGVCFIDPHGDVAEELIGFIPKNRENDLIYFNPGDFERSFGLNMLEWDKHYPFQKSFVTNELLEIFNKIYDLKTTGGPVFEQYFRNTLLLLLNDEEETHTLNDIPRVLINPSFRKSLLAKNSDPMVNEFWEKEAEKAGGEMALANIAPYINSKMNPFLANDLIRPIVGQKHSSVDFRKIMDDNKILIVNLSKGLLGDTNSYLLGMIVVGKVLMAAFSRVEMPEEQRKDFYLYIDEFQNITTDTIGTIFSEARKYHLNLVVANQFLGQLKESILKSIFGNAGTIIAFRVGNEDGSVLAKYFEPVFSAYDLLNLDNFNAYVKMITSGETSRAFSLRLIPPPKTDSAKILALKNLSSFRYCRLRQEVEKEIRERYQELPKV